MRWPNKRSIADAIAALALTRAHDKNPINVCEAIASSSGDQGTAVEAKMA